ncbi:MAG: enoyl-CoA hydratase [Acidimicrobiia bacterium]
MPEFVTIDVADRIAVITLSRPEARNSMTPQVIAELIDAVTSCDNDDAVDVMILTGSDPVFCAGLDLKELEPGGALDVPTMTKAGNPWPSRRKPMIAAVNGPAVTGGLELALLADLIVASKKARFGDTHARVGIMPFWGLTARLPQVVGWQTALLMSLTGNFLTAEDAYRLGMVAALVEHDDLLASARRLAVDIASADQPAIRAILNIYRDHQGTAARLDAEVDHARAFQGEGFDNEAFARRREAIMARGRAQR